MKDIKKSLADHIEYSKTYWYHKMKAFEHISKEAEVEWEKCFQKNQIVIGLSRILGNEELMSTLLNYEKYGNFYTHCNKSFECGENSYPKSYDETFEDIHIASIEAFYDWLERDIKVYGLKVKK